MAAAASGVFWALTIFLTLLSFNQRFSPPKPDENHKQHTGKPQFIHKWDLDLGERKILNRNDYILADLILSLTLPSKTNSKKMSTGKYDHRKFSISLQMLLLILLRCGDIHPCPGPTTIQINNNVNMSTPSISNNNNVNMSTRPNVIQNHDENQSPFQCIQSNKGLHFLHLNARSVISKLTDLRRIVKESQTSVLAISESWLDSSITDEEIKIDGYSLIRGDRNRNGGGVCLYIKNNIPHNRRMDLNTSSLESLWIDLLFPKTKPITVGACYRPPNSSIIESLNDLEAVISKINMDDETYILGDFNINFGDNNSPSTKRYNDIIMINNFYQLIDMPTRITPTTSTILDHILCNTKENVTQSGILDLGISDHMVIFCTRKILKSKANINNVINIRSMKNYDRQRYNNLLRNVNWNPVLDQQDVNTAWSNFKEILNKIIEEIAPKRTVRVKSRTEPWMTGEIIEMIHLRDKAFVQYKKKRTDENVYRLYCELRNLVQNTVKVAKSEYFSHQIVANKNNPKKLWSVLKNLGSSNKSKNNSNIVLNINDELCHDSKLVANHINNFFTNVALKLVDKLPQVPKIFGVGSSKLQEFYHNKGVSNRSCKLKSIEVEFVKKELKALNENKSTGLDDISSRFLKDGADILCIPILHIVNLSLTNSTVPSDFKKARITPLYKKNSKLEVGNYRPISVLSAVSKILERAVFIQLDDYLQKNNLLYKCQSGFRSNHSTNTCLVHLTDFIKYQISVGNYVGLLALDVQKAFDCVDHKILCSKLELMGVDSTWFNSYLTDRKQTVVLNYTKSDTETIKSGVPQGSILGPLLYLCYCNDMELATDCDLVLYADDSIIVYADKDPKAIETKLSKELTSVNQWLIENKLSLHPGKCESILFGTKRKINRIPSFCVNFNNQDIIGKKSLKYLGSIIENDLSGKECIDSIVKKANGRLKFLYRHRKVLSRDIRKILCMSLVQCHLDYACISWYYNLTNNLKHKLQVLQNKMVRFILDKGNREHIGQTEFIQINCTNIDNRVKQIGLNIVHKLYYLKKLEYLLCKFIRTNNSHSHNTQNSPVNF